MYLLLLQNTAYSCSENTHPKTGGQNPTFHIGRETSNTRGPPCSVAHFYLQGLSVA